MKTLQRTLAILILLSTLTVAGQSIGEIIIQVNLPPSGQLYPEELYDAVYLINNNASPQYIRLKAVAKEELQGLIFEGFSGVMEVPVGTMSVTEEVLEGGEVIYSSAELENYVLQTGSLPAGSYNICLYAMDAETGMQSGEYCFDHLITNSSPPALLQPADGDEVTDENPVFLWTPPVPQPMDQIPEYNFVMTEVMAGMSPQEAISQIPAWISVEGIQEPAFIYPPEAREMTEGATYAWQVQSTLEGFPFGENGGFSEIFIFEYKPYMDSTIGPCDTATVNHRIRITIDSITTGLCGLNNGLVDSLMNLYDKLEDEMWQRDSLSGAREAAEAFKQTMTALRNDATGTLQQQIAATQSLGSNGGDCGGSWESDFYSRYVSPNPTQQRINIYNQYVKRYKRRFDKCKAKRAKWLNEDKDEIDKYYNNHLDDLDDIVDQINDKVKKHNQNIADLKNQIAGLSAQLSAALCDIDIHWNAFIQYLDSNTICIKCGKVYYSKPPNLQVMDSCLNNLYDKIKAKKAGLRSPKNKDDLKNEAEQYFPFEELQKEKKRLDSLRGAFNTMVTQWNGQSTLSKMVHPCCQSVMSLAGGRYLYGHQNKPFKDEGYYGRRFGLGNSGLIAVPANPQQMQDPNFRRNYYKDKRVFYKQRYNLSNEIDKAVRNLKSGHSGGRSYINGLKDVSAVQKHGMVNAVDHHNKSADSLRDALNQLLNSAANCYDDKKQNHRHREYLTIHHRCFNFRQCIEFLDDEYENYRDSLTSLKDALQQAIGKAEKELESLNNRLESLSGRHNDLKSKHKTLNDSLNTVSNDGNREKLRKEVNDVGRSISSIGTQLRDLINAAGNLDLRIALLRGRLDDLTARIQPRPVASITDCEAERRRIQQAQQQQANNAGNAIRDAETISGEIQTASAEASATSDDISLADREATGTGSNISDELAHQRYLIYLKKLKKEREIKGICSRILAEHFDKNSPQGSVFDSLAAAYEFLSGNIIQLPGGHNAFVDKMKEFQEQIDDAKETIEDIVTLLSGVHGEPSLKERNAAFEKVLKYAAEFGDKVPGFGEMVSFYADAYKAAINAIYKIMDDILAPVKRIADNETRVICPSQNWQGKTLDQIVDDMWRHSTTRNAFNSLSLEQRKALESYYKEKAKNAIVTCCLEKLGK